MSGCACISARDYVRRDSRERERERDSERVRVRERERERETVRDSLEIN